MIPPSGLQSLAGAGGGQGSVWQRDQSEEWEAGRVCPEGQEEAATTWLLCDHTQGAADVSVVAHWCVWVSLMLTESAADSSSALCEVITWATSGRR